MKNLKIIFVFTDRKKCQAKATRKKERNVDSRKMKQTLFYSFLLHTRIKMMPNRKELWAKAYCYCYILLPFAGDSSFQRGLSFAVTTFRWTNFPPNLVLQSKQINSIKHKWKAISVWFEKHCKLWILSQHKAKTWCSLQSDSHPSTATPNSAFQAFWMEWSQPSSHIVLNVMTRYTTTKPKAELYFWQMNL